MPFCYNMRLCSYEIHTVSNTTHYCLGSKQKMKIICSLLFEEHDWFHEQTTIIENNLQYMFLFSSSNKSFHDHNIDNWSRHIIELYSYLNIITEITFITVITEIIAWSLMDRISKWRQSEHVILYEYKKSDLWKHLIISWISRKRTCRMRMYRKNNSMPLSPTQREERLRKRVGGWWLKLLTAQWSVWGRHCPSLMDEGIIGGRRAICE
jgi:hypothetical protein